MRQIFSVLCITLLLCGPVHAQPNWANGKPLKIDEVESRIIDRIEFAGNATTRDSVLRRALRLREGELFKLRLLKGGLRRLNQLGLFERVTLNNVTFRAGRELDRIDLLVTVKEKKQ